MNFRQNKAVIYQDLGLVDYKQTRDYQEELFREVIAIKLANRELSKTDQQLTPNYLLFCEHQHVYTIGKSGDEQHLLANEELLESINASFYRISRGGDITYHGPGQIVGYPILDLENFFTDIHRYLRFLEEAIINMLATYGIHGGRVDGLTGVWLNSEDKHRARKICAMGIKASRWVTMHGFAFNVNTDLTYFGHIVPCGIEDRQVTSLQKELNRSVDINEVKARLIFAIADLFEMKIVKNDKAGSL